MKRLQDDTCHERLRRMILGHWEAHIDDYVSDTGMLDHFDMDDYHAGAPQSELRSSVRQVLSDCGIVPNADELENLCGNVPVEYIVERNMERALRADSDSQFPTQRDKAASNDVADIDDLFDRSGQ
jgi:hypothetical protein